MIYNANEEELSSVSLQISPESGLPFDSSDIQARSVRPVSPDEVLCRTASRRRKLGGSPIVVSSKVVQTLMEREMVTRGPPSPSGMKVNQQSKRRALQRLKKLRTATPDMPFSSLACSLPSTPGCGLEVEMPSSSSLTDPTSSPTMQRVGRVLLERQPRTGPIVHAGSQVGCSGHIL